ncbi:hypothetical protein IGI04_017923 [Brassica rapa subsp. trilocularis]|uniref:Uncharacterized protein n=1 Tax=Brassica rapa subsp. trilocularis TaxID=1813537 RepID=A0ABQ7MBE9_BRACM|nr:hypothetical protein IGI04_017923 [Brassica rapa subsp. trilocularis]
MEGRHSKALSDEIRCGLSLVALELALCVVELVIVYSSCELSMCLENQAFCVWCALGTDILGEVFPRSGRLKLRMGVGVGLAQTVSLKWSVKIAAVDDIKLQ